MKDDQPSRQDRLSTFGRRLDPKQAAKVARKLVESVGLTPERLRRLILTTAKKGLL